MVKEIDVVTGRSKKVQYFINLFPKSLRLRFNPRRYAIESFVNHSANITKKGSKILDAGAGPCPYKSKFTHCAYEATDFKDEYKVLDFVCSLDKIPKKDETYDAILCTEVLEHVEKPQEVINELYRITKKGGKLFLTVPQEWMVHQKPYNFYYFTNYGLESLVKNAGFRKYKIVPMGGWFWVMADAIKFNSLINQWKKTPLLYYPLKVIGFPFTQIIMPFLLFHLDGIDQARDWTMGYTLEATK